MKADTLTLTHLFNKPVCFVVPLFQRPYVWNKGDHWLPLWEDFRLVAERLLAERASATPEELERGVPEQRTPSHFLGAVVVEQLPTGAGMIDRRHVIDGQQRLATLQLFLDAAHDVAVEFGDDTAKLFAKLTDNDLDLVQSLGDRYKVWPTNIDQAAFRYTIARDSEPVDADGDIRTSAMWGAHEYFCEAIRDWLSDHHEAPVAARLDALRTMLWSLVRLVVIDLEPNDNAQIIFETLNARGTPLLASDLIKNSLFQQTAERHLKVDQLYGRYWKALDADWWRETVTQGRLNRPRLDVFFFHWLTMRRGSEFGVHELFTQFKRYSTSEDQNPESILDDVAHHARTFKGFEAYPMNSDEETFFYRLRATETTTATPLLLLVMGRPDKEVEADQKKLLLRVMESWLMRRMLCRLTTKHYNIVFMNLLGEVGNDVSRAGDIAVGFFRSLQGESQVWPDDEMLDGSLLTLPLYRILSRGRLRIVLEAFEDAMRSPHVEEQHAPRGLTIEHVLPQAWQEHWRLHADVNPIEATSRRDILKHTIGNLTLVTTKLNPKLSNTAWSEKRVTLQDHTVLFLNKQLVNSYPDAWDEDTISERGRTLAALARGVWPGPSSKAWGEGTTPSTLPSRQTMVGLPPIEDMTAEPEAASPELAERMTGSLSHDAIRRRSTSLFVHDSVDALEDWLTSRGVEVRHHRGSYHSLHLGKKWLGGYYFARGWIHFWLVTRFPADDVLADLSDERSALFRERKVSGNVRNERDVELFKQAIEARLDDA